MNSIYSRKTRMISLFLVVMTLVTMLSVLTVSASAVNISFTTKPITSWQPYGAHCALSNAKKDAKVRVTLNSTHADKYGTCSISILMRCNGKVVWAEDKTIVAKSISTSRVYKLGKDHSSYDLFFRASTTKMLADYVTVVNYSNANVSVTHY